MVKTNKFIRLILSLFLVFVLFAVGAFNVFAETLTEENQEIPPKEVSISFDSMGGSECETIYGYAGTTEIDEDMLPIPTKEGHTFKEWRHFNEYGMPFELGVFPNYDIKLVAAYEPDGFFATFEEGISEIYDINCGISLYAPGADKYSQSVVKEGWRCLVTKKNSVASPMFLLSYHNALEVGKEYEISLWIKSENLFASGSVDFVFAENPDVRADDIGCQKGFGLGKMKKGEWKEYRVKFIAAAPYMIVRLPNVNGIYIDNVYVKNTGVTGEPQELMETQKTPKTYGYIYIVVLAVLVTGTVLFIFKKKK